MQLQLIKNDPNFCWARANRKIGFLNCMKLWRIPCLQAL